MRCPSCSTDNETGRKFCGECGTRLISGCPSCGAANAPGTKFCGECGAALTAGDEAASGGTIPAVEPEPLTERRIVSILFADLVGFTTLAEGRDPEEIRELQDRYFATSRSVIERYGGTVEKFIGDAVMAVWGAPTTYEDDPERAVRAALELLDAIGSLAVGHGGPSLVARAAVMTGEAAVTLGADDRGLVSGDLVNSASRLQGAAAPGTVLIDDATRRATAAAIATEPLGDQDLRGRTGPVAAWRALHVLGLVRGRGRTERLEPPFVGREAELRLLKDLLHATDDERRARLVSVVGIAGIGKSRLAWELEKYIDGLVGDIYWHQGRSPAYGEGITFWALAEMVRGRAGIAETDERASARGKLETMLEDYVDDEAERKTLRSPLLTLLGFEETPLREPQVAFAAWRRLFERIAERGLVVLVFEDLQWADTGLVDFIGSILEWSRGHRILVVTLARPELLDRRPTWGARQRNFTALHLEPLPEPAMLRLLDGVAPGLPRAFARRIVERAAGVPLFAVETLRMLIDEGRLVEVEGRYRVEGDVAKLAIPESLRGLIGARIDGLPAADRALLQDAAVLGQSFTLDALAALTGQPPDELRARLGGLVEREILAADEDPRSPERGQYAFVQGVIREVAYDTLAKRERRLRHLAAARYFETLEGEEMAGILASHYLLAHLATPPGPEADALAAQARVALRGAAERATALGSYALALGSHEQALTVTIDPTERAATWEAAARAAYQAFRFDDAERNAGQALAWHRSVGDRSGIARAAVLLSNPYHARGRTAEARAALESALAECAEVASTPDGIALRAELARVLMMVNDPGAIDAVEGVLIAAEPLGLVSLVAEALVTKASALDTAGRRLEAIALGRGAIELAASAGLTTTELRGRANYSVFLSADSPRDSLVVARAARELARGLGMLEHYRWSSWLCCGAAMALGAWDEALDLVADLEASDATGEDQDAFDRTRAQVAAYQGDAGSAARFLAVGEAVTPPVSRAEFLAGRHIDRATVAAFADRLPEAYDEALAAARLAPYVAMAAPAARFAVWLGDLERTREAVALVRVAIDRGRHVDAVRRSLEAGLAALEGRHDEARAGYRAAAAAFRELDTPLDLGLSQLDHATLIGPADPEARAAADEAREIFTRLGTLPLLDRLVAGLERWRTGEDATALGATERRTASPRGPGAPAPAGSTAPEAAAER